MRRLTESRGLAWFQSSSFARRGFCRECGSSLFWDAPKRDTISVTAGSLKKERSGGDEVAVHNQGTGEKEEVEVAERLGRRLQEEGVSASLGVAVYAGDLEDLFLRADQALYRAKALGKGRVVLASPQGRR